MQTSCIIPTRDRCQMVQQAITSALEQTVRPDEIIVVDDGSSDDTAAVISDLFPQVIVTRLTGLGAGPARNAGAEIASGDILMFLDSDDLWGADHVKLLLKTLARGYDVAYGITETADMVGNSSFQIPGPGEQQEGNCLGSLLHWCFLVPSAVAISRDAFDRVGGFNNEKFEDWSFFLRLADNYPFGFINHIISFRTLHKESLSILANRNQIISGMQEIYTILSQLMTILPKDIDNFSMRIKWLQKQKKEWNTLQDWYLAMKKEGFIDFNK